jgi:ribosomal protein L35
VRKLWVENGSTEHKVEKKEEKKKRRSRKELTVYVKEKNSIVDDK